MNRRDFLKKAGWGGLSFVLPHSLAAMRYSPPLIQNAEDDNGYGPLMIDSDRIMDLPRGFSYKIISRSGERMSDGYHAPSHPDGMGAFSGPDGLMIVLRNHEIFPDFSPEKGPFGFRNELMRRLSRKQIYDQGREGGPALGSVTTLVFDTRSQELKSQFLSLAGTLVNCSGGATTWNTWLSCEEIFQSPSFRFAKRHGYVFEIPASEEIGVIKPIPLQAMGRFVHEAVALDPRTNILYQTEDQPDGLIYRFIPARPGKLEEGGLLQCLSIASQPRCDTRNWEEQKVRPGEPLFVTWINLEEVDPSKDVLRYKGFEKGAAIFASGEGITYKDGILYFDCTNGGRIKAGQIWRYIPSPWEGTEQETESPGQLELFIEPNSRSILEHPDQMSMTPGGDLFVCEDGYGEQHLLGVTLQGSIYRFARNALDESEFAGVCFSPDGSTMFVNYQDAGLTFAVIGPWK